MGDTAGTVSGRHSGPSSGPARDWAVWKRVDGVGRPPLDLLHASLVHRQYAPHMHEEYAIGACTAGQEVIWYRGERRYAGPGTVVVVEPGEPHTGAPAAPGGFTYRVLYPPARLLTEPLGELLREPGERRPHFPDLVIHDPELASELRAVHAVLGSAGDALEGDSRLAELIGELVRRHAAPLGTASRSRRAASVARPVMSLLADQMAQPPTLTQIAAELGLSRFQLLRAFREEVGMPPYAWLAQHRVTHAKGLLDRGERPAEVASLVGFADQAHLTRWFRRVVGVTPGAYRNSVQDSVPEPGRC
jgi:AraC-like DNA-binding protein